MSKMEKKRLVTQSFIIAAELPNLRGDPLEPLGSGQCGSPNPDPLSFFTGKIHPCTVTLAINLYNFSWDYP